VFYETFQINFFIGIGKWNAFKFIEFYDFPFVIGNIFINIWCNSLLFFWVNKRVSSDQKN
jgi:hypothetical protein